MVMLAINGIPSFEEILVTERKVGGHGDSFKPMNDSRHHTTWQIRVS
jgi:hypothetical protein